MYDEWTEDELMEGPAPGNSRLTYDDFLRFPDDGKRHEIIDGVHSNRSCSTAAGCASTGWSIPIAIASGSGVGNRTEPSLAWRTCRANSTT